MSAGKHNDRANSGIGLNQTHQIKQEQKQKSYWYLAQASPNLRQFTYHNHKNSIHGRIDRIFVNKILKKRSI